MGEIAAAFKPAGEAQHGTNTGGAWSRSCWLFDPNGAPMTEGCQHPSGAVAGGQIGVNWQSGNLVAGLEAAGDWAGLKGSQVSQGFPDFTNETRTDAIGTFTGRLGWASNAWLLYVKGGAAVIHNRYDTFITATPFAATLPHCAREKIRRHERSIGRTFQ